MVVWHMAHWSTWGRQKYFDRVFPAIYEKFLPSSYARDKEMGWEGARSGVLLFCDILLTMSADGLR